MKQRRISVILIALLCATVLLSGTLLILHTEHECHQATCPICEILARRQESFLSMLSVLTWVGACLAASGCLWALPENRFVPDWTPVRRKVKLQD